MEINRNNAEKIVTAARQLGLLDMRKLNDSERKVVHAAAELLQTSDKKGKKGISTTVNVKEDEIIRLKGMKWVEDVKAREPVSKSLRKELWEGFLSLIGLRTNSKQLVRECNAPFGLNQSLLIRPKAQPQAASSISAASTSAATTQPPPRPTTSAPKRPPTAAAAQTPLAASTGTQTPASAQPAAASGASATKDLKTDIPKLAAAALKNSEVTFSDEDKKFLQELKDKTDFDMTSGYLWESGQRVCIIINDQFDGEEIPDDIAQQLLNVQKNLKVLKEAGVTYEKTATDQPEKVQHSIKLFVREFLQPYLDGRITSANEPKDRKPMVELLQLDLAKKYPGITLDKAQVEEIAYNTYLKEAILELKRRPTETDSSLINALLQAIPKDFPSKKSIDKGTIEKDVLRVRNELVTQNEKSRKEIQKKPPGMTFLR